MILDGKTQPIFRVELKDDPSISFEANTPSNPWLTVMRAVEKKKKEVGMTYTRTPSCSGPEFFGLANHAISRLISKLPDFEKIENKKADLKKSSEPTAPTKHFARGSSGARRGRAVASSDSTSESDDSSDEEFQSNAMQSSSSSSSLSSESESESEREGENVEDRSRTNQIKFIEAGKKSESEDEKEDEKQEIKEEEEEKEVEQKQQKSSSDSNNKKDDDGDDFSDDSVPIPANDASEHECEQQPEISETQEEHGPSLKFNFKKLIESAPASEIHILIPGKQKEITDFLKDDHVTSESIV